VSASACHPMAISQRLQRLARQAHRSLAPVILLPIILLPIILTSLTGSLYPMLRSAGIAKEKIKWMLQLHSGNFLILNLKPIYPFLVGLSTLLLALTGLLMVLRAGRRAADPLAR